MFRLDPRKILNYGLCELSQMQVYSDLAVDYFKMLLLNVPATVVALGLWVSIPSSLFEHSNHRKPWVFLFLYMFFQLCTCSFFFLDDITGFEITYIMELSEPYSFIFTWFAAVPVIVYLALSITKLIIKDFLILKVRTITQDCKRKTTESP